MSRAKKTKVRIVRNETTSTRDKAIAEAKRLLQQNGFNGFSFQHIADRLGIKKASLYSHFASKEELGREVFADYRAQFDRWSEALADELPDAQIAALFDLFQYFSNDDFKICPLTAFSLDLHGLTPKMKKEVSAFTQHLLSWIESVIADGKRKKLFASKVPSRQLSTVILGMGIGAQLTSRLLKDTALLDNARDGALTLLNAKK